MNINEKQKAKTKKKSILDILKIIPRYLKYKYIYFFTIL